MNPKLAPFDGSSIEEASLRDRERGTVTSGLLQADLDEQAVVDGYNSIIVFFSFRSTDCDSS